MTYQSKNSQEARLQRRIEKLESDGIINDYDYRMMFWRLWGACANHEAQWQTFHHQVSEYLDERKNPIVISIHK